MERMAMKWKKHKILGAGSYGTVHLAAPVDSSFLSASLVAVKSADADKYYLSSPLQKEAAFLKELRGKPNIIQCFGEDTSLEKNQKVYNLILEYASGGSLYDLIKKNNGTIPESHVAIYAYMLLRGISAMHDCDIVHCDLKPENILVFPTWDGLDELKIADLGLAKKEWEETGRVPVFGGSIFCRGTLPYTAPESMKYGVYNKASDIWSFGCIVLEMISGKPIWSCESETIEDLVHVVLTGIPEKKFPKNLSGAGKDFLMRCLTRRPDERWTAKNLITHPFIVKNFKLLSGNHPCQYQGDSFGHWISTTDLFSSIEANCNHGSFYNLFPDNKGQESQHPLGIPCGVQLMNLIYKPEDSMFMPNYLF